MILNQVKRVTFIFAVTTAAAAHGQRGRWATADNTVAKFMIDAERQWAEAACTHTKITEEILADDFRVRLQKENVTRNQKQ